MKKSLITVIIIAILCLVACSPKQGSNSSSSQSFYESQESHSSYESQVSQETQELIKISTPYTVENLSNVLFTDVEKDLTVDVSENTHLQAVLLGTEYYTRVSETTQDDQAVAKYVLALQGIELQIGLDGGVDFLFENGTRQQTVVLKNEFSCLETLIDGESFALDGYTASHNIKVYDAENKGGAIADKEDFLEKLQALRFVKLNDKEHYQIGTVTYTVQLGNDQISIYAKHIMFNGDLYYIYQGNFDFLAEVEFDTSSGWLPWL